jgi:hypothetical protein
VPEHPSEDEAKEAAKDLTEADSLLPGEQDALHSRFWDDAKIWYDVYEELSHFKHHLLAALVEQRNGVRQEGRHEVQNDKILLTREADRLSRRLEFWQEELRKRTRPSPG